jgi:hypothetical protein
MLLLLFTFVINVSGLQTFTYFQETTCSEALGVSECETAATDRSIDWGGTDDSGPNGCYSRYDNNVLKMYFSSGSGSCGNGRRCLCNVNLCDAGQYYDGECKSCASGRWSRGKSECDLVDFSASHLKKAFSELNTECGIATVVTGCMDPTYDDYNVNADTSTVCACAAGKYRGDMDMYVGNSEGKILYFRNNGVSFVRQSSSMDDVDVGTSSTTHFVDYDNDGDFDAFIGNYDGYILYYRNNGSSASPSFVRQTSSLDDIDAGQASAPFFVDDDGDGDLDLYVGNLYGQIRYYHNNGSSASPSFVRSSSSLEGVDFGDRASPFFVDDDNDGDMDMYVGNYNGKILYYRNNGSSTSPSFTLHSSSLDDVDVGANAKPFFVDDDNDGDMDLYVGQSAGEIWYYKNTGSITNPYFARHSSSLDGVDVGARAAPFVILNSNNCTDCPSGTVSQVGSSSCTECPAGTYSVNNICTGCAAGKYRSVVLENGMYVGNEDGKILYYRNDGTRHSSSLDDVGAYAKPFFVDIDNDGDLDLYVGNNVGKIAHYRNNGDSFVRQSSSLDDVDVGYQASPAFVDIDNDGDFDAFIGNSEGQIWYYRNDGSSTSPSLVRQTLAANPFYGADVGKHAKPFFVDDDNDGDMDAYVGNYDGEIWYYRNDGSSTSPSFTRHSSSLDDVDVGDRASPFFVDDDNDGDLDLYVGNLDGEIWYYHNDGNSTSPSLVRQSSSMDGVDVGNRATPFFIVKPNHCVDCPSGSVSLTGSLFCSGCPSGQYAEDNNCKSCPHGFSSSAGSISCSECAAGLYYADGGCKVCTAGRGSSVGSTGSSSCSDCEAGKYGNGGCKPCAVGMYQNENGQTACKSCAFGSSLYGSDRCGCIDGEINSIQTTANYTFVQKDTYADGGSTITVKDDQGVVIMNSLMPTSGEEGGRKETEFEVERGSTYSFTVVVDAYAQEQSYEILNNYKDVVKAVDFGILKTGVNNFNFTVSSCSKCPTGTYFFDGVCKSCPVGTSSPTGSPGSSSCFECEAGKYSDVSDGVCKSCPSGQYQGQSGQAVCNECASGWVSSAGSSSCFECEAGKYSDGVCKSCPSGQYQDESGKGECKSCPSGKALIPFVISYDHESVNPEHPIIGYSWSEYCDVYDTGVVSGTADCKAGYTLDDAKYYCSINDWCFKILYFGLCGNCDGWLKNRARYWFLKVGGDSPSTTLIAYADVYTKSKLHGFSCFECEAGKYSDVSDGVCKSCPSGFSSLYGSDSCVENGDAYDPSYSSDVVPCNTAGKYQTNDGRQCLACSSGKYMDEAGLRGSNLCKSCPYGKFTPNNDIGDSQCNVCQAGMVLSSSTQSYDYALAPPGTTSGTWLKYCQVVRLSNVKGDFADCQNGFTLYDAKEYCRVSDWCVKFAYDKVNLYKFFSVGGYSPVNVHMDLYRKLHDSCFECAAGKYSSTEGLISCVDCSPGLVSSAGSSSCSQCAAGQYQGQSGQTWCSQCAAGQFSSTGLISCVDCSPGLVSSAGSSSCSQCAAGRYSNALLDGCVDCPNGWTSTAGSSACSMDGQYTRQLGYAWNLAVSGQSNFHSPAKCKKAVQNHFGGATATQVVSYSTVPSGCTGYWTGSAWEPHLNTYSSGHACGTNSAGSYTGSGRYWCVIPGDYSVGGAAVDGWGCVGATYAGTSFCSNLPGWDSDDYNPNSYKCCVANECAEGWFHHSVSTAEICMGRNVNGFLYN